MIKISKDQKIKWPKNHPEAVWNGTFCCYEIIWNLKTQKLQMRHKWTFAQMDTNGPPENEAVNEWVGWRSIQKTTKNGIESTKSRL